VEEEEEDDVMSSDRADSDESEEDDHHDTDDSDSSDAGELNKFDPRARPGQQNQRAQQAYARTRERNRVANVNLVPLRAGMMDTVGRGTADQNATFGQRRGESSRNGKSVAASGGMEISWVPSASSSGAQNGEEGERVRGGKTGKGVETFGMGLERGGEVQRAEVSEGDRRGRTHRRQGVRSGSRNALRRTSG